MKDYEKHKLHKEFRVDYHKSNQHVSLNLEIDLFNAPCQVVSIDYRDFLGQIVDEIKVDKIPLNSDGEETSVFKSSNNLF